jgi:hypothetical protein
MRSIRGDVDLIGLDHLVQDLAAHGAEGDLTLSRGSERQTLHLGPAGFRLVSSTLPRVKRIARIARLTLGRDFLNAERLREILRKEKLLGWSLGHLVLADAPPKREDVEEALRRQVEEEVLDLFVWTGARFVFQEIELSAQRAGQPLAQVALPAKVTSLLLEAARREDEARQIRGRLGDERKRLKKAKREFHADALGEDVVRADAILPLINGSRSLKGILHASIYPNYSTLRALDTLFKAGYVEVVGGSAPAVPAEAPLVVDLIGPSLSAP